MMHRAVRRCGYASIVAACLVLFPFEARGDGAASQLHLRYEAPAGCPTRQELLTALDSRIQTSWVAGSDTRSFDARVMRAPEGGFVGKLEIRQPDRAPSTREIHGDSCKAVTTSIAVFIAIAVDPESEEPPPKLERKPAGERRGDGEHRSEEAPRPPIDLVASPRPRRPPPAPPEQESRTTLTWRTGYAVVHHRSPRPGWGHRLTAELALGDDRERIVPALRLSWGWSNFSTYPPLAGEARFRRQSVRLEGCGRYAVPPFAAAVCGGLDAGALTAAAPDLPRFFQVTTRWAAATGTVRLAWSIAPWLEVELSAGLLVPFERRRFTVQEPERLVYRAPFALVEGSAGVGVVARFR